MVIVHVVYVYILSKEETRSNRRWSKESIVIKYIGGRDRVEPEVIEWEYCYLIY